MLATARLKAFLATLLFCSVATAESCKQIQYSFPTGNGADTARADAVKQHYLAVWTEYDTYALGNDSLLPVAHAPKNDFYGWGLSIVDGLDTAVTMNMTDVVAKSLAWIYNVDFTSSDQLVGGFDAMIRYVAGLLSAYDLINNGVGGAPAGGYNQSHVDALLWQARTLSDKLKPMFDTPTGIPMMFVNFTTNIASNSAGDQGNSTTQNTAITGTIIHEWHRLSDLTGDPSYRTLADRAESHLINPHPAPKYPFLVGGTIDFISGNFTTFDAGWQSGIDSFYEYLIKTYIYNPASTPAAYRDFWLGAANSTLENLALHPFEHEELTFITQLDNDGNFRWYMDDYACFAGGNLLLGGKYLNQPKLMDLGLAVTDSCHRTYNATKSGLNPLSKSIYIRSPQSSKNQEKPGLSFRRNALATQLNPPAAFSWFNASNQTYNMSRASDPAIVAEAQQTGFFIESSLWTGFPEPIESLYYAYRISGDAKWRDYAWQIFEAITEKARQRKSIPFSCLFDITQADGGGYFDYVPR